MLQLLPDYAKPAEKIPAGSVIAKRLSNMEISVELQNRHGAERCYADQSKPACLSFLTMHVAPCDVMDYVQIMQQTRRIIQHSKYLIL